jgi:hypothetical protein
MKVYNTSEDGAIAVCACHEPSHQIQVRKWHGWEKGETGEKQVYVAILSRPVTVVDRIKTAWSGLTGEGFQSMDVIVDMSELKKMIEEIDSLSAEENKL